MLSPSLVEARGEQAFVDSTLLGLYVRRPDLVRTTSARLRADRSDLDLIEAPIQTETEMGDHADPMPVEPDVVPVQLVVHKPNFWHYSGYYSLRFMQNYVSDNWYKGGESNYSALGSVIMEANYNNKQKVKWENKLEMRFRISEFPFRLAPSLQDHGGPNPTHLQVGPAGIETLVLHTPVAHLHAVHPQLSVQRPDPLLRLPCPAQCQPLFGYGL